MLGLASSRILQVAPKEAPCKRALTTHSREVSCLQHPRSSGENCHGEWVVQPRATDVSSCAFSCEVFAPVALEQEWLQRGSFTYLGRLRKNPDTEIVNLCKLFVIAATVTLHRRNQQQWVAWWCYSPRQTLTSSTHPLPFWKAGSHVPKICILFCIVAAISFFLSFFFFFPYRRP